MVNYFLMRTDFNQNNQPRVSRWPGRAFTALLLLTALPLLSQYPSDLQYQSRDSNRHEGLKPKPVSGYDVELLSALVAWSEPTQSWPENLHLRFYLPAAQSVSVTVRQPRPKTTYYWLDQVVPSAPWRAGAFNDFTWSTAPVLQKLPSVTLEDLGVVVRLDDKGPSRKETIAPAALFHTQPPPTANGYRFIFKTNGAAHVTCTIYSGANEVYRRPQNHEKAGSPFVVSWDPQGQPEGMYRLTLTGYFDDNTPLEQEEVFYHRASWR
jgi:hypothetical protein